MQYDAALTIVRAIKETSQTKMHEELSLGDGSEGFALYLKLKPLVYRSTYLSLFLKKIILTIQAEWHL